MKNYRRNKLRSLIVFSAINLAVFLTGQPRLTKAQSADLEKARRLVNDRRDLAQAMDILAKLPGSLGQDAEVKYLMARIDYMWGKYRPAYGLAKAAVEISPSKCEYHVLLAKTSGSLVKLSPAPDPSLIVQVKRELDAALTIDPNNIDAREVLVDYYYELPPEAGGSIANAYKEAQAIVPLDSARGRLALGDVYMEEQRYAEMDREYHIAIAVSPSRAKTYQYIAATYVMLNRTAEGRAMFRKAYEIDPADEYSAYQMGLIYLEDGVRLHDAEGLIGQYFSRWPDENRPTWADAHYRLGQVYQKENRAGLAEREWREALKLDPNQGGAKRALEALQSK
jgi:tetratricopeptide (TPR) repeat protein